jgi:magnesium transporter
MTEQHALTRALTDAYIAQYPQEATEALEAAPIAEIVQLLQAQPAEKGARIMGRISTALATAALRQLKPGKVQQILAAMDPVGAALLLGSLDQAGRETLLADLDAGLARELQDIMSYPEGSAGRLMQPRATSVPARLTVSQALNRLRQIPARDTAVLVVTDDSGRLVGLMDLGDVVHCALTR